MLWPCGQQWSPLASRACRSALLGSCFQGSELHVIIYVNLRLQATRLMLGAAPKSDSPIRFAIFVSLLSLRQP